MDLGPIAGIRAIVLPSSQRAKRDGTPHFEVDASERSGDDAPKNQDGSEHQAHREKLHALPDTAGSDPQPTEIEIEPDDQHNWFV